jgi:hypothetical protein
MTRLSGRPLLTRPSMRHSTADYPPGTATPRQPARLPARRLTGPQSTRRHHDHHHPARRQPRPRPPERCKQAARARVNEPARQQEPTSDPAAILRNSHRSSSVGTTPAVLSVTLGALGGTRTPNLLIRRSMESVRPVRWSPDPQVSVLPGIRHGRHSPVPSAQSVRKL